jgi:hypothetical protein
MSKIKIVINPKFKHLKPTIEAIAYNGIPEYAETIYSGRNSIHKLHENGELLSIKSFKVPNIINKFVYTNLRRSKARRSYETALRLLDLGINTPEPFAYIEEKIAGKLHHSYYICRHIEAHDMRYIENCTDKSVKLKALAAEILKVHRQGVRLLDFSPGNILYCHNNDGEIKFYHIDINRIKFGVKSQKELGKMFGSILVENDDIRTLAAEYAQLAGLPKKQTIEDALSVRAAFIKHFEHKQKFKKFIKRCLK